MKKVVIVSACRTAVGVFGGSLLTVKAPHLAGIVMKEALRRASNLDPKEMADIRFGSCFADVDALNIARVAALLAGLPVEVPAVTINRVCVSGMEATVTGTHMIQAGFKDCVMVGGVESMSNVPYAVPAARWGVRLQDTPVEDIMMHGLRCGSIFVKYPKDGPMEKFRGKEYIMGHTAEFLANKYKISREDQDEVALRSHNNVERATREGLFKREIVPVPIPQKKGDPKMFEKDEHYRPNLTMADLTKLNPAFLPGGTVTAGNASGLNDGASAMILMSEEKAKSLGLKPLATITGVGSGGCQPEIMGESPIPAVLDLLRRTGRKSCADYERIEINEAFAAQYIAVERGLNLDRSVTNVNGSGVGMGHPIGSTGCRLLVTLLHELQHANKHVGMATLCGGGGVSLAVEITREH